MRNITTLKILDYFQLHSSKTKQKQQYLANRDNQQDAGFTLIELIVVVLLAGILAAIAAPGWVAFTNRQQLNKANDAVLAALQEAQREAQKKKLSYTVSFRKNSTNVEVAVYRTDSGSPIWKPLGTDVGINSEKLLLGANLGDEENAVDPDNPDVSYSLSTPPKITFDYMGSLSSPYYFGEPPTPSGEPPGLKITLAIPSSANSTSASNVKRCVIVKTLLGSIVAEKDSKCD
ncbi:MAG: Tfp pilus assembly protein FimT/FimU [Nostoc sp. SerVER01]|nr:type II secretion system protein [Nostoc sp. SerVER01]MDZ8028729.1 type II secretion system protein [Nostoc sp. DedQUE11]MDZ8077017.1 type II secretion system protein [Nostoc sp. DedQUE01]MDZ8083517.1 type II secretion system protein [Nostoc sp. DcaGUA01]